MTLVVEKVDALDEVTEREHGHRLVPLRVSGAVGLWPRRRWFLGLGALGLWAFADAMIGQSLVNPGGWTLARRFTSAALHPQLDADFVRVVVDAALTTVSYALVGTAVALGIGLVGGVLSSETWWTRDALDRRFGDRRFGDRRLGDRRFGERRAGGRSGRRRSIRSGWLVSRALAVVPRGLHEAVWALILLYVLGRNPLVAVLGIGIPFGAITAKVVAEMIDDAAAAPFFALRAVGAGRFAALVYGIVPVIVGELISYTFYRFECAMRSSVALGAIGAGGLGFELLVSFQSLRYEQIWTMLYALIVLAAVVDGWGAALRRHPSRRRVRASAVVAAGLAVAAAVHLGLRPSTLIAPRARRLAGDLASEAWPPSLPRGGWSALGQATVDTLQLSIIAITVAALLAVPLSFAAVRRTDVTWTGRVVAGTTRLIAMALRAVPPPVGALIVLFVVFPGSLAGGLALAAYTLGVLVRLNSGVIEHVDPLPSRVLRGAGAAAVPAAAYGTLPMVTPRLTALAMYRWEVAMRETVIVGLVGAGGLGRMLAQQNASFDESAMVTTLATLVVLALAIDLVSSRVRAVVR
ncbi:phosphonate ABC transporter, permease protein PhnE [soil metagenome]